jgi:hypothetical protein
VEDVRQFMFGIVINQSLHRNILVGSSTSVSWGVRRGLTYATMCGSTQSRMGI